MGGHALGLARFVTRFLGSCAQSLAKGLSVGERLPLIWAILIPRYTTTPSDFAEERVREVLFVAVGIVRFGDRLNRCSEFLR